MNEQVVVRVVSKLMIPPILVFGLYVILHGDLGPGGGFQGGVILAAAFVIYGLVFGVEELERRIPPAVVHRGMALGVLIYACTGLVGVLRGGRFLDYTALMPSHPGDAEAWGMLAVESGVGLTVCCVMITVFSSIAAIQPEGD